LAGAAGGSFTILRRRFARISDQPPGGAQDGELAPLVLASAWEDNNQYDRRIVSHLAAAEYADIQLLLAKWRQVPDAPVRLTLGAWEFISPLDAWELLHPFLCSTQMARFEQAAAEVLTEDNPALELPAEERYMASVKGKKWKFSSTLRRGIAEMLALGATREEQSCIGTELRFAARAQSLIQEIIPKNCSWTRWASLDTVLPLLMEAAPDALLDRIEQDIASEQPQLVELMRQEIPGGLVGAAYHCGVLWALETATWPKERFHRIALCLARLNRLDPGGKWGNNWHTIPGTDADGAVSAEALKEWVRTARQKAREVDRLEVCDSTIGGLFAHSCEDADGAKPVIPVREVIEKSESEAMERGFAIGLMNLRGPYFKSLYEGGAQEHRLAAQYSRYAGICVRWPRTASVLRSVAADYTRRAVAEDERARTRD